MNKNLSVIAGIGNPGERYERTLHNVGFWFVDEIAATNNLQFSYHKNLMQRSVKSTYQKMTFG